MVALVVLLQNDEADIIADLAVALAEVDDVTACGTPRSQVDWQMNWGHIALSSRTLGPGAGRLGLWHRVYPTSPDLSSLARDRPRVTHLHKGNLSKMPTMRLEDVWRLNESAEKRINTRVMRLQSEKAKNRKRNKSARAARKKNR